MEDAESSPSMEVRSTKRARLQDLDASRLNGSSLAAEAAVPTGRQPTMHTEALRSVLKGVQHIHLFCACLVRCSEEY